MRVIFYFDGFNFYNGLSDTSLRKPQWKNYYWIDLYKLAKQFYPNDEVVAVRYFTAPPLNTGKRGRQAALFGANNIINGQKFIAHKGEHIHRTVRCEHCTKEFKTPEEKRTDVGISVTMLTDCLTDKVDTLILISADTDQIPTIDAINTFYPNKKVKVYFPPGRKSSDMLNRYNPVVFLEDNEEKFKSSIMPEEVIDGKKIYKRPENWKHPL